MMTLKQCICHQLREMKRELLKALDGLSAEDVTSHDPGGHSPVAWIVQHCCANVDFFIHKGVSGEFAVEHEQRYLSWPIVEPKAGDAYPSPAELAERWVTICDAGISAIKALTDQQLQEGGKSTDPPEPLIESCMRVVNHQNVHIRQIWQIRGLRALATTSPTQETWLA